jgi:hypothetical protein
MLGVDLPVHLVRRRPRGNPTIPRAPCAPTRCGRALCVGSVSRLGRVGPGSVLEWAGLAGRRKAGSSGAVRPWAASGPRGWIYLNFLFLNLFWYFIMQKYSKNCRKRITTPIKVKQILLDS